MMSTRKGGARLGLTAAMVALGAGVALLGLFFGKGRGE